jgi:putative peptidoglycan lipid II flippase
MALLLLLSRVLGQVRDTVISIVFGSNQYVDAYRAAFSIPDLLFFLIAGGALSSAFIPVFAEYIAKEKEEEAWRIFSTLATLMGIVVLAFVICATIWTEPLVRLTAPGLPEETRPLTVAMARILLPAQFGFFLGGLMFGTMNARNHFLVPGLSPSLYNVGIIAGALVIAHFVPVPVFGLAWGALFGALLGNLIVPTLLLPRFGAKYRFELNLKHPGVVAVFRLMMPVVLGLSLPGVYAIIVRGFASHFEAGIINDLELSNRLMQAPLGILGQGFAIAVFPTLSTLYALSKREEFLAVLGRTLQTVLYLTIFVSAAMFFFSADIVRVLNEYGRFTPEHTEFTARGLQMFSIGIFAWCGHPVMMRAYFAIRDTWTPVLLGSLTTVVFFALCALLTQPGLGLGYRGLPLASSIAAILLFGLMLVGLRWRLGRMDGKRLARLIPLSAALAVLCTWAAYEVSLLIPSGTGIYNNLASGLRLFLGGLAAFWAYLYLGRLLGLKEAEYALTVLLRKRGEASSEDASSPKEDEGGRRQS